MANLEEFTTYKQSMMQAICTSDRIVDLLRLDIDNPNMTGKEMRYNRIFPYNYVPLTTEHATTYICFTVTAPTVRDDVTSELLLTFFVFTHQDLMRTDKGIRTDLLVSEIDKLLNGSTKYGLGKVSFRGCDVMQVPCRGYAGLYSVYSVKDFNNTICKVK